MRIAPAVTLTFSSFNHGTTLGVGLLLNDCDQVATVRRFKTRLYSAAVFC